jgi:predicted metal-dependent phosphoesterase TrpH
LPVLEAIAAARDQGALVGIPHPFDRHRGSLLMNPHLEDLAEQVDWVETWNARIPGRRGNERAAAFARTRGLPGIAVSDAHSILEVGMVYSILHGDPSTAAGLREALQSVSHGFAGTATGSAADRTDPER